MNDLVVVLAFYNAICESQLKIKKKFFEKVSIKGLVCDDNIET